MSSRRSTRSQAFPFHWAFRGFDLLGLPFRIRGEEDDLLDLAEGLLAFGEHDVAGEVLALQGVDLVHVVAAVHVRHGVGGAAEPVGAARRGPEGRRGADVAGTVRFGFHGVGRGEECGEQEQGKHADPLEDLQDPPSWSLKL
jgi:hypothetical protein